MTRCLLVIFIFALFHFSNVYSQKINLESEKEFPINISESIGILKDSSTKLKLDDVLQRNDFQFPKKDHFIFPYSDDIFWVKFDLKNTGVKSEDFVLIWTNPLVEQLDFYITDSTGKGFLHKQQKILTIEKEKKLIDQDPSFALTLKQGEEKSIYFKITSKRGHYGTLRLHTKESYQKSLLNGFSSQSFFNGLVIFRLFLVLVLSLFIIKDFAFRLYSLHTVIKTFAFWGYINIAGPWFTNDPDLAQKIDFVFYNSVTLGAGIFVYYTQIRGKFSKIHSYLSFLIIGLTIFESIIVFFDYQWYWLKLGVYSIIFSALYFSIIYLVSIIRKISIEKYYAIPFILGLMSYALLYVRLLGWIEYAPLYSIAYFLFFGEIFVFVIFLGGIFRNAQQKLNFSIEQNNRLKDLDNLKTNFFANISHEFRTPLTLILAPAKDLVNESPNNAAYQIIYRNANRLLELINQLLDITKIEAGQMNVELQKVNLSVYFRTLISSFTSLAQSKGITFEFIQNKNDAWANVDSDKIEKIITNLLSNAFKFTNNNKKVEVKIDYLPRQIVIQISDEGIGISEDKLDKIFDRFYQVESNTNRKFEGTGIGLALVKELVEVMKGQINVRSKEGLGTTFEVVLPIKYETQPADASTTEQISFRPAVSNLVTENSLKVAESESEQILLIVDDNADIRTYIRGIFENEYRIVEAVDGKDGLAKANEQIPNLVISDLMMPEMDGFEFCKHMKTDEKTSHIPIIMLTAKANIESRIEGLELGADDYLIKPFHKEEIEVRVRNLIMIRENLKKQFSKEIVNLNPEEIKVNSVEAKFLNKIKEVVEANIVNQQFDVEQFAAAMNMSAVQLRRKMKSLTNFTVVEYVRNYRLQKAANLLKQKTASVSEIAYQVGFESLPYFSRVFQEHYGVPPSEYKPE
ncbi:MAG: ATP-binding protein [Spirosomataceae bacterium]